VEAVREEEVKLQWVGFVKEVGFKPGVKERWSYRCTKWWKHGVAPFISNTTSPLIADELCKLENLVTEQIND